MRPFSCRGRSFCPSCEKKRSLLRAEWLREEVLEAVARVFLKRRELLLDLAQSGAEAIAEYIRQELGVCPGIVVSVATAGDMVQWHPHLHILLTDGGFSDGAFWALSAWDGQAVMRLLRERLHNTQAIEDLAGYVVRNPLSLKRLVYLDGQQAVIYRGLRPNPRLGRDFESMDPFTTSSTTWVWPRQRPSARRPRCATCRWMTRAGS